MQFEFTNHHISMLVAFVVSMIVGFIWYGPLFGRKCRELSGVGVSQSKQAIANSFILEIIATLITVYVLSHWLAIFKPSMWHMSDEMGPYSYGFWAAFWAWFGFVIPRFLSAVAWEKNKWGLFWIRAIGYFVNFQIITLILVHWR